MCRDYAKESERNSQLGRPRPCDGSFKVLRRGGHRHMLHARPWDRSDVGLDELNCLVVISKNENNQFRLGHIGTRVAEKRPKNQFWFWLHPSLPFFRELIRGRSRGCPLTISIYMDGVTERPVTFLIKMKINYLIVHISDKNRVNKLYIKNISLYSSIGNIRGEKGRAMMRWHSFNQWALS